jgi:hypothetical protein
LGFIERLRRDHEAASHVLDFLIGGSILIASLTFVIFMSGDEKGAQDNVQEADLGAKSVALSELILSSTGVGWYAGGACDGAQVNEDAMSPDSVQRFGLGAEVCDPTKGQVRGNLSFDKLVDLQRAKYAADGSNGHLDYAEAAAALGLTTSDLDFHLRTQPVLSSIRAILASGHQDPNLKPLYIGDYESTSGVIYDVQRTEGYAEDSDYVDLWVNVTNNGVNTTAFEISFTVHLDDQSIDLTRHTPLIGPGDYHNTSVRLPKSADWDWASSVVDYIVSDVTQVVGSGEIDLTDVDMTAATAKRIYEVHSGKLEYLLTGSEISPKIYYSAFEGDGDAVSVGTWKLEVFNALGLLVSTDTSLHDRGWESFTLALPGEYTVKLKDALGFLLAEEKVTVVLDPVIQYVPIGSTTDVAPQSSVTAEIAYVDAIIEHFQPFVFSAEYATAELPYVAGGDVMPDIKSVMNNDLPSMILDDKGTSSPNDDEATLSNYNVIVVGSNVDHQIMTSQHAKDAIRDWVYAGGTLVVFGSNDQAVQWLQPIFHSSIDSASGGLFTPDENHPVLKVPNDLDYTAFDSHGLAWDFTRDQDAEHFTHVLLTGDADLLALSDHGEFGDGRVLLSAYQPFDIYPGGEDPECDPGTLGPACQGLALFHNLITQSYAGLFVDYGPPIPLDRPVGVTTRIASVYHPELDTSVAMQVTVYVF